MSHRGRRASQPAPERPARWARSSSASRAAALTALSALLLIPALHATLQGHPAHPAFASPDAGAPAFEPAQTHGETPESAGCAICLAFGKNRNPLAGAGSVLAQQAVASVTALPPRPRVRTPRELATASAPPRAPPLPLA